MHQSEKKKKKEHKIRMITRRSAFDAPTQNKRGVWDAGEVGVLLDRGTSCRKKRCKTSIADKTILAFDIRVKEPRHRDTVMSKSHGIQCRLVDSREDSSAILSGSFSVFRKDFCYLGQIFPFKSFYPNVSFAGRDEIRIRVSRSK